MKTQVSNRALILFAINAENYAKTHPHTKLGKACQSVKKANQALIDDYYDKVEDINRDHAIVDDSNHKKLVYEDLTKGIYAMTKDGKKLATQKIKELNIQPIDVTYKHVKESELPVGLASDFRDVFTPFVIAPVADTEDDEAPAENKHVELSSVN